MGEDLGGIIEILLFTIAIFAMPVSEFSFTLSSASKLFLVRSGNPKLIDPKSSSQPKNVYSDYEFTLKAFD